MATAPTPGYDWLAGVLDPDGQVIATAVLYSHNEGLVPDAVLDEQGNCELRFPEGFTKRATVMGRALGIALVNTGGETGPRQPPVGERVAATLAGPCTVVSLTRSGGIQESAGQFAAGGNAVSVSIDPEIPYGAALLYEGLLVAVVREASSPGALLIVNLGELIAELADRQRPQEQAASKGPPPETEQAQQVQQGSEASDPGPLPYTDSTRTAYGLAIAIGSTRPGGLPPTDPGVLLLGLLAAGRGPLADEAVPRALYDLLAEPRDERLAEALGRASSSADLETLEAVAWPDGQPMAGSDGVMEAAEAAARAAGVPVIAVREYAAAVVAAELDDDVLDALGVTTEQLRDCVAAAAQAPVDRVLEGLFAADQLVPGEEPGDELGTKAYATMLATLVAKQGTPMPISIGLFGEWGSGKSYFMELLRREVTRLSGLGPPYLDDVVQLTFNAWHYSDTNLWASLGAEFFEQLLGPQADPVVARRAVLRKDLAENQQLALELSTAQDAAVAKAGELREQLDSADRQREAKSLEWDAEVLRRVVDDPELKAQLTKVDKSLGLSENADRAVGMAREVAGLASDAAAIKQVLVHRRWRWTFLAVLLAMGAMAGAVVASDKVAEWLGGGALVAVAAALSSVSRAVAGARAALEPLRKAAARARAVEDQMRQHPREGRETELAEALKEQEARAAVLGAQLADTVARAAALDRELGELHPGRRLYRFIADRVSSADYRGQLGIVSTVRHDFEELSKLMKETWPNEPPESGVTPIQRIVLYIDDLDRCEPDQVVAVLQAVHLLMAMDLFVVVVGVDPRWLLRSLRRQYRGVMGTPAGEDGFWATTPQNYLEKIFQIPFVLPGMGPTGFDRLMRSLARPKQPGQEATPVTVGRRAAGGGDGPGEAGGEGAAVEAGVGGGDGQPGDGDAGRDPSQLVIAPRSEIAAVTSTTGQGGSPAVPPPPAARQLTEHELQFLARLSELVATPRAAKRLFNIYGLLRSTSDVWPGSSFLGGESSPGEYQVVAQLLAILASRPELLGTLMWGRRADGSVEPRALCRRPDPGDTWSDFIDGLAPREAAGGGWENNVADALTAHEVAAWTEFVTLLQVVQSHVKLDTLEPYRQWAPKIARFSFVLSPFADDEPDPAAHRPSSEARLVGRNKDAEQTSGRH